MNAWQYKGESKEEGAQVGMFVEAPKPGCMVGGKGAKRGGGGKRKVQGAVIFTRDLGALPDSHNDVGALGFSKNI